MKEVAYTALTIGFIGTALMIISGLMSNSVMNMICSDDEYLIENYGHDGGDEQGECNREATSKGNASRLYNDIGYPLLLFAIVLMIGANKLQDS